MLDLQAVKNTLRATVKLEGGGEEREGRRERGKKTMRKFLRDFGLFTCFTGFHIAINILSHMGPPEHLRNEFHSTSLSLVSSGDCVVMCRDNISFEFGNIWNNKSS